MGSKLILEMYSDPIFTLFALERPLLAEPNH